MSGRPPAASRSPTQRTARTIAIVTALAWIGFGGWLIVQPRAVPTAFGVDTVTDAFAAELRAFYGGLELGLGIALLLLVRRRLWTAAMLVGGATLLGTAIARTLGVLLDAWTPMLGLLGSLEYLGAAVNLWAARQLDREALRNEHA